MIRPETKAVRSFSRRFAPMLLAAAIALPVLCNGCTGSVRVYDPYYHDYHVWASETPYYTQWEHDTHRDHMDFNKRSKDDQKAYWDWRHNQH
ncbi:MAG: hypothetical protein WCF30_03090 [Terracidiphilus sp.]